MELQECWLSQMGNCNCKSSRGRRRGQLCRGGMLNRIRSTEEMGRRRCQVPGASSRLAGTPRRKGNIEGAEVRQAIG